MVRNCKLARLRQPANDSQARNEVADGIWCTANATKFISKHSAVAEMGDRGHNRHGRKEGGAVPFSRGELWVPV